MPLKSGKSKEAFSQNVRTEMNAGKPKDQALAIAYATKRRARKYDVGGVVDPVSDQEAEESVSGLRKASRGHYKKAAMSASGDEPGSSVDSYLYNKDLSNRYDSEAASQKEKYLKNHPGSKYADGGMVYNDNEKLHPEAAGRASYPQEHKGETMNDSKMIAHMARKRKMSVGGEVRSLTDGDQDPHDHSPGEYSQKGNLHEDGDVPNEHDEDMRRTAHEDGLQSFSEGGYIMGDDADNMDDEPMGNSWESDEFLAHSDGGRMTGNNHSEFDPQDEPTKKRGRLERVLAQIRMEQHGKK